MKNRENTLPNAIKSSSDLMGLTEKDLSLLLGKELSFEELRKDKLSIESYMKMTEFYLLSEIDLLSNYNQQWQINRICKAILEGEYIHRPTPLIKKHLRAYKRKTKKSTGEQRTLLITYLVAGSKIKTMWAARS